MNDSTILNSVSPSLSRQVGDADLEAFRGLLLHFLKNEYRETLRSVEGSKIEVRIDKGRRYARIFSSMPLSADLRIYGFIDLRNGDLLMAASYKTPAKHARGNIFSDNPLSGCTTYGMEYLR